MVRKLKNFIHKYEAKLANYFYGSPTRKISTIGVTGTDGKTTTATLIFHILRTAGYKVAMVTTIGAQINDKKYDTGLHTTTPSSFTLQSYIKKAVSENCDFLVLEVTSHALDQNRVHGVNFKVGVLTNITHEHLDYHKTYEKYVEAKKKLLDISDIAILNKDDKSFATLEEGINKDKTRTYSRNKKADYNPGSIKVKINTDSIFNLENYLAAIAAVKTIGVDDNIIQEALSSFKFPEGRQEIIYDNSYKVIIDFAHTPNSFERVLPDVKRTTKGRLIHIFGAAGERDKSKRPIMGRVSSKYADVIILTAEDPRNESQENINAQIKSGIDSKFVHLNKDMVDEVDKRKTCIEISDRKDAIKFAINMAKKSDTIIITGKGHEKSMNLGKGEIPWSDKEVALSFV